MSEFILIKYSRGDGLAHALATLEKGILGIPEMTSNGCRIAVALEKATAKDPVYVAIYCDGGIIAVGTTLNSFYIDRRTKPFSEDPRNPQEVWGKRIRLMTMVNVGKKITRQELKDDMDINIAKGTAQYITEAQWIDMKNRLASRRGKSVTG